MDSGLRVCACVGCATGVVVNSISRGRCPLPQYLRVERSAERLNPTDSRGYPCIYKRGMAHTTDNRLRICACVGCATGVIINIISRGRCPLPQYLRVERSAERWDTAGGRGRSALNCAPLEPAAGVLHGAGVSVLKMFHLYLEVCLEAQRNQLHTTLSPAGHL